MNEQGTGEVVEGMSGGVIYTIGHGVDTVPHVVQLLKAHGVQTLVDVRTYPHSGYAPDFDYEALKVSLVGVLEYHSMGRELGGMPRDKAMWDGDKPNYERLAKSPEFRKGIEKLLSLASTRVVAVMCSEGHPKTCHRSILLAPELRAAGWRVVHILHDGRTIEDGAEVWKQPELL